MGLFYTKRRSNRTDKSNVGSTKKAIESDDLETTTLYKSERRKQILEEVLKKAQELEHSEHKVDNEANRNVGPSYLASFTKGLPPDPRSLEHLVATAKDFEDFVKGIESGSNHFPDLPLNAKQEISSEKPQLCMLRILIAVGFLVLVLVLGIVSSVYDVEPWNSVLPSVFQLLAGAVIGAVIGEKVGNTGA